MSTESWAESYSSLRTHHSALFSCSWVRVTLVRYSFEKKYHHSLGRSEHDVIIRLHSQGESFNSGQYTVLRYALFDLDNTIYPSNSGLWEAIGERINRYMIEKLGMDPTIVKSRREEYLRSFGTTLKGLRKEHDVDAADFLRFVHDLPLGKYLKTDASLDAMLGRLPLDKIIFTNADAHHARRVLSRLGVNHHFERIIDIHALEFVNKPDPGAYRKALEIIRAEPEECLFVDDSPLNLAPARKLGMLTVLVCGPGSNPDGANHIIHNMIELEPLLAGRLDARRGSSGAS